MKYYLRDLHQDMVEAWDRFFSQEPDVEVSSGEILEGPRADAIVGPANSFGFMDSGIDVTYSEYFGRALGENLRAVLKNQYDGELPVGQAVTISTWTKDYPYLISAPTMRVPMVVAGTVNAYLAFRAVIREVARFNKEQADRGLANRINSVLCPGLGTGVGKMRPGVCARQMYFAYRVCEKKDPVYIPAPYTAYGMH